MTKKREMATRIIFYCGQLALVTAMMISCWTTSMATASPAARNEAFGKVLFLSFFSLKSRKRVHFQECFTATFSLSLSLSFSFHPPLVFCESSQICHVLKHCVMQRESGRSEPSSLISLLHKYLTCVTPDGRRVVLRDFFLLFVCPVHGNNSGLRPRLCVVVNTFLPTRTHNFCFVLSI